MPSTVFMTIPRHRWPVRGRVQIVARLLFAAGRPDEGERQYLEARDRFADAGDDRRLARCDAALALDLLGAGRFEDAEGRAEAAVAGLTMLDHAGRRRPAPTRARPLAGRG